MNAEEKFFYRNNMNWYFLLEKYSLLNTLPTITMESTNNVDNSNLIQLYPSLNLTEKKTISLTYSEGIK